MPEAAVHPHHVAQKSMSTGVLLLRTCSSKSASLTLPTHTGFNTASLFGLPALWVGQGKEPRRDRLRGDPTGQVHLNGDRLCIRMSRVAGICNVLFGVRSGQASATFGLYFKPSWHILRLTSNSLH